MVARHAPDTGGDADHDLNHEQLPLGNCNNYLETKSGRQPARLGWEELLDLQFQPS